MSGLLAPISVAQEMVGLLGECQLLLRTLSAEPEYGMSEKVQTLIDFGMLIVLWLVQIVIYPSFLRIEAGQLASWHQAYTFRVSFLIIPLMKVAPPAFPIHPSAMDKKIVLTGCTSGLGLAMVHGFIENGATVAGLGRNAGKLAELREKYPSPHRFDAVDVSCDVKVGHRRAFVSGGPGSNRWGDRGRFESGNYRYADAAVLLRGGSRRARRSKGVG